MEKIPSLVSAESDQRPYGKEQLNRALLRLREDCLILQKRAEQRFLKKECGPGEVEQVVDTRIRKWLIQQLSTPGRYAHVFMEKSHSQYHARGDVTLVTRDGAAVIIEQPMAVLGFHYLVSDIKRALPVMAFCEPALADEMRAATSFLMDLSGFLKRAWPISQVPAPGLVPVELDPKAFTEQSLQLTDTSLAFTPKRSSKGKNVLPDPSLDGSYQLQRARIGAPITLMDGSSIAKLLPVRPVPPLKDERASEESVVTL